MNKSKILETCYSILDRKIDITQQAIHQAQESANNETKSSAGDKYETGRAMSQNERDMNARHLVELLQMKKILLSIDPQKEIKSVEVGAIIKTAQGIYFISVALGKIDTGDSSIFAISAISPIAQNMLGKHEGESFNWSGKQQIIEQIV